MKLCDYCDNKAVHLEYGNEICEECYEQQQDAAQDNYLSDFYGSSEPFTLKEKCKETK